MLSLKRSWGYFGLSVFLGLLLFFLIVSVLNIQAGPTSATTGWTPVFTDTFTITSSVWTISSNLGGDFEWHVVPYTRTMGTAMIPDSGFWVGGEGVTDTLTWPSGTYTNGMTTQAVAGPFTPTAKAFGMRLQFRVQNRIAPSDTLFVGLSQDNVNFTGMTLTEAFTDWQTIVWQAPVYTDGMPIWMMLRFVSDEAQVDAGPLIDDLILEVNYGYDVYLPLIRRDPTPTPPPTPEFYRDDFDDSASGWFTGAALRLNWRLNPPRWEWEKVAYMSYTGGHYATYIPLTAHGGGEVDTWFVWPAHAAPLSQDYQPIPDRYCIEARGKFANSKGPGDPWWAHWGIVFGANETFEDLYTFQINANGSWAVIRYPTYVYPGNRSTDHETKIQDWSSLGIGEIYSGTQYNTVKVVVRNDKISFYANDIWLLTIDLDSFPQAEVGLIAGDWEVTPVDIWIDYFRYEPNCAEAN